MNCQNKMKKLFKESKLKKGMTKKTWMKKTKSKMKEIMNSKVFLNKEKK